MAYAIMPSLIEDPSPYPWCAVQKQLAPGQEYVSWNSLDSERIKPEWQPRSVLKAVCAPEPWCAPDNPDISYVKGGVLCVSARAREMIEGLEPDIHQFFPVDMFDVRGAIREPRRYIVNVCRLVDAIVDGTSSPRTGGGLLYHVSSLNRVSVRRDRIAGLHVWRDKQTSPRTVFVSDTLYDEMSVAKIGAFDLAAAEEV
jgi:hypothetical protein